jgi:hypothetical protein
MWAKINVIVPTSMTMSNHQRIRLANFFERLATVGVSCDEWSQYIATHYQDPIMEQARHSVAKSTFHFHGK